MVGNAVDLPGRVIMIGDLLLVGIGDLLDAPPGIIVPFCLEPIGGAAGHGNRPDRKIEVAQSVIGKILHARGVVLGHWAPHLVALCRIGIAEIAIGIGHIVFGVVGIGDLFEPVIFILILHRIVAAFMQPVGGLFFDKAPGIVIGELCHPPVGAFFYDAPPSQIIFI